MSKNLSLIEVIAGLAVGIIVIWYMANHGSDGANDASPPSSEKSSVGSNDPLSPIAIATRIKSLDDILSIEPPSITNNQYFIAHIKADDILDAAETSKKILNSVHNHIGSASYAGVKVDVAVEVEDRYGRQSMPDFLMLTYSSDDISKMVFPTIATFDILNLARLQEPHPGAYQILGDKCSLDSGFVKYMGTFCSNLAALP